MQVVNTSGQPGTNSSIQIRGTGSVNGNIQSAYYFDGVYEVGLNAINPQDIESSTVLKMPLLQLSMVREVLTG